MTLARACRNEGALLARHLPRPCLLIAPVWLVWVRLQEPPFLRDTAGVYWPAASAALQLFLAMLPFVWIAARTGPHLQVYLRATSRPDRAVLAAWGGSVAYGAAWIIAYSVLAFTVNSIDGTGGVSEAASLALFSLVSFAALASLAPAVASLALSLPVAALVWCVLAASSLFLGVPVPTSSHLILPASDLCMALLRETMVAMLLATAGGLLLSVALARWRLGLVSHAHRHPGRHP